MTTADSEIIGTPQPTRLADCSQPDQPMQVENRPKTVSEPVITGTTDDQEHTPSSGRPEN